MAKPDPLIDGTEPPLVSVVVPAYCRARTLRSAVESALTQTVSDLEVIVVDDGSTDGTGDAARSIADPRVTVLAHETNRGGNAARQTGIEASRGRWIAFLDSDDVWLPDKLERQLARLAEAGPDYGLCYTWYDLVRADGGIDGGRQPRVEGLTCPELMICNEVGTFSTMMVDRTALDAVGGVDPVLPACQDWDFAVRVNQVTALCVVPEVLVHYSDNAADSGRITTRKRAAIAGHRIMYTRIGARAEHMTAQDVASSRRWFIGWFAEHGATAEVLRVARDLRLGDMQPEDASYIAHMTVRSVRRRVRQLRANVRSRSRSR